MKSFFMPVSHPEEICGQHFQLGIPCPNLGLLCIRQLDAAPFNGNYAKLYFDAKHLEKELNRGREIFGVLFSKKSILFGQYRMLP